MLSRVFSRSQFDSCVYLRELDDGSHIYLLLYVDDMLIAAKDKGRINKLKKELSSEFEMKDLGGAKKILGMEIHRDRESKKLYLSLEYVQKIIEQFGMTSAKPVATPLGVVFHIQMQWVVSCMLWYALILT